MGENTSSRNRFHNLMLKRKTDVRKKIWDHRSFLEQLGSLYAALSRRHLARRNCTISSKPKITQDHVCYSSEICEDNLLNEKFILCIWRGCPVISWSPSRSCAVEVWLGTPAVLTWLCVATEVYKSQLLFTHVLFFSKTTSDFSRYKADGLQSDFFEAGKRK